ncbi:hypothetical protein IT409_02980 [Candidatus Falkowbacteria bacterium]|nr:hypothetical protein [Candidatus Falkowbacteria bacterium]
MQEIKRLNSELHQKLRAPETIINNPSELLEYFQTHSMPLIANRLHKLKTEDSISNREQLISDIAKEEVKVMNLIKLVQEKNIEKVEPEFGLAEGEELSDPSNPENYLQTKNSTEGAEEYFVINNTPPSIEEYENAIKSLKIPQDILAPAIARIVRENLKLSPENYQQAVIDAIMADGKEIMQINSSEYYNRVDVEVNIPSSLREYLKTAFKNALTNAKIEILFTDKKILADPAALSFLEKNKSIIAAAIDGELRSFGVINKKAPK